MAQDLVGISGTDNKTPVYDPDAKWCIWGKHEIWTGGTGDSYIPKVHDYVIEYSTFTTYIVDELDPVTMIPTLRQINPNNVNYEFSKTDVLFGVSSGTPADTYRIYLNKTVTPFSIAVDQRCTIPGSAAKYAKLFRVVNGKLKCISKVYSGSGEFISENVLLELIQSDSHETHVVKGVPVFYTTEDMPDSEVVIIIFYSDAGLEISKKQLLVENTTFIRGINYSTKYVSHISLSCPFMSPTITDEISYPLNVPIDALNLVGTVHYSDGSSKSAAVDGTTFKIFGLDTFTSSIEGQAINLVLAYPLGIDEQAMAASGLESNIVTAPYTLRVVNPNNSYSVKLFGYPEWISAELGYTMKWWLYNMDRDIYHNVTSLVVFDENRGPFNPLAYGYVQQKSVSINLRSVSQTYKAYTHSQSVAVTLFNSPDTTDTPWTVSNESNGNIKYGKQLSCRRVSGTKYSLANGCLNKDEWLKRLYTETQPLIDKLCEITPPVPNKFVVMYGTTVNMEFDINDWNKDLDFSTTLTQYSNVYIRFIRRVGEQIMELSIAGLTVKY